MSEKNRRPVFRPILGDLLMTAAILAVFFFFQIELPLLRSAALSPAEPAPPPVGESAVEAASPAPAEDRANSAPSAAPDPRTPWQIAFAEHFTDEIVRTDTSYSSPEISITLSTHTVPVDRRTAVYHVADIYVADIGNFSTYTANNELRYFSVQDVMEMDRDSGAVLSISGDGYCFQSSGFLVRNGQVYMADQTACDICVLYRDGRMVTYGPDEYRVEDILAEDPWQVWSFGPSLLDDEGGAMTGGFGMSVAVNYTNPRSAVGYYEPGHYCFVVVDGRQRGYSDGMLLRELSSLFSELGCAAAYNLDGGGSAVMIYEHERFSRQSNGADREIGDLLVIREREGGV